ncbi:cupin domain-containing protein [Belliella sp. DSM 107340]|uniref:Cupin domain-containing protein n=1 Tax=Belliella calami TaxID=2923436 RepID=A0ABS9UQW0_9BACT|nr:cupin domain-containing protein [Belliella calami]MCH7398820.1 cupin domain-containing protein [Belliella calami]
MIQKRIKELVAELDLIPHPEGGYYKEIYRSDLGIGTSSGERSIVTSIYFLLTSENVSKFHQIKSDEMWFYHEGSPLTVHVIDENGQYDKIKVGPVSEINKPQQMVPAGVIFGSTVDDKDSFALVSCVVAPGFDFDDFRLYNKQELLEKFPTHKEIINILT